MTVPKWVQDAIFYQVFPDRFANGDESNDPHNLEPWGSEPTRWGFQGGDLRGVINKFDYLLDLGVNAIYFNPIFLSSANHRYHTVDYYKIDPRLGDMADFRALLEVAHQNGLRVILDGVFNHSGRGFFPFSDLLENREHSAYKDWFHINKFPIDAYSEGESQDYRAWWGIKDLPKFNTDNPEVRQFLFGVARYWIEQGIDGWRLDVPAEIDDDQFWADFREVVKSVNAEAYILGEVWEADPRWVGNTHFDGLMNYPLREALFDELLNGGKVEAFANELERLLNLYERENVYAMYLPLGSHDTRRLKTRLDDDVEKVKLAFAIQFALPGAPGIYYGDEIGLTGEKDPQNRRAFPWDEKDWNLELRGWVQGLVSARKRSAALRRGDYQRLHVNDEQNTLAFSRTIGEEALLVALNASGEAQQLTIPVENLGWTRERPVEDFLTGARYQLAEDGLRLNLPPWGAAFLG